MHVKRVVSQMDNKTIHTIWNNIKNNLYTLSYNIFNHRDNGIWLFGAWMGEKFSDNSRFLFQYLHENKGKYGIEKVVWVTRNKEVLDEVKKQGYEAYLIGTEESKYYHLKAGVHVICNSRSADISAEYSFGAKKIQLWHGNGIKASGKMTRKEKPTLKEVFWDNMVKPLLWPGFWFYCYWLASSEESKRVLVNDSGALDSKIIIANSPRLCQCLKYSEKEKNVLEDILRYKMNGYRIILYLPTFRTANQIIVEPLDINGFSKFLSDNSIIWIEKRHSAEKVSKNIPKKENNIYYLDKDFDVNILYDYIDVLVSDYSSATTDAIFKDVVTMEYCPDFKYFQNNDRGFVGNYNNYHIGNTVFDADDLEYTILKCLKEDISINANHHKVKKFLFDENKADYDEIMKAILGVIYKSRII